VQELAVDCRRQLWRRGVSCHVEVQGPPGGGLPAVVRLETIWCGAPLRWYFVFSGVSDAGPAHGVGPPDLVLSEPGSGLGVESRTFHGLAVGGTEMKHGVFALPQDDPLLLRSLREARHPRTAPTGGEAAPAPPAATPQSALRWLAAGASPNVSSGPGAHQGATGAFEGDTRAPRAHECTALQFASLSAMQHVAPHRIASLREWDGREAYALTKLVLELFSTLNSLQVAHAFRLAATVGEQASLANELPSAQILTLGSSAMGGSVSIHMPLDAMPADGGPRTPSIDGHSVVTIVDFAIPPRSAPTDIRITARFHAPPSMSCTSRTACPPWAASTGTTNILSYSLRCAKEVASRWGQRRRFVLALAAFHPLPPGDTPCAGSGLLHCDMADFSTATLMLRAEVFPKDTKPRFAPLGAQESVIGSGEAPVAVEASPRLPAIERFTCTLQVSLSPEFPREAPTLRLSAVTPSKALKVTGVSMSTGERDIAWDQGWSPVDGAGKVLQHAWMSMLPKLWSDCVGAEP
jgi:hypothetical protein